MIKRNLSTLGIAISKPAGSFNQFYQTFRERFRSEDYYKSGTFGNPRSVYFNITSVCNFNCPGCHVVYESRNRYLKLKNEELDTAKWKDIVTEIGHFKPHIYIVGGEPLLRNDLIEIITHISRSGCLVSIVTNGALLTRKKCDQLIEAGLNFITISLDGSKNQHEKSRGVKKAFEQTFKGIENMNNALLNQRIPTLKMRINCVINKFNFGDIDSFKFVVSLREKFKMLSYIDFIPNSFFTDKMINLESSKYQPMGYKLEQNEQREIGEKKSKFIPQLIKLVENNKSFSRIITVPSEKDLDLWFSDYIPDLSKLSCSHLKQSIAVYANGDVSHCLGEVLGNVRENTLMEIYHGQKAVTFRKKLINKKCRGCSRCCATADFSD